MIINAPDDPDKAEIACALMVLMSEISENSHCAGWYSDLEYDLWAELTGESVGGKRRQATFGTNDDERAALRSLSRLCGGWIIYGDDGEEFVPLNKWEAIYAERQADKP